MLAGPVDFSDLLADDFLLLLTHVQHRRVDSHNIPEDLLPNPQRTLLADELPVLLETVYALVLRRQALELLVHLPHDPVQSQLHPSQAPLRMFPELRPQHPAALLFLSLLDKGLHQQILLLRGPLLSHLLFELFLLGEVLGASRSQHWYNYWGYLLNFG